MPRRFNSDGNVKKRVPNACKRCRKHKIKCSGTDPCKTCDHRGVRCEFGYDEKKVVVNEKYLNSLRQRLACLERNEDFSQPRLDETESAQADAVAQNDATEASITINERQECTVHDANEATTDPTNNAEDMATPVDRVPNPLVHNQPSYTQDVGGKLWYLGHSSTWSFSRQVLELAHQHSPVPDPSYNVEGEAYNLSWKTSGVMDLTGLPSREVSLYLLQTVKFRTSPLFQLFDEECFSANLDKLYQNPSMYSQTARVWTAAHIYIGQAVRMAQSFGLHADIQVRVIGDNLVQRCRRIWWTVYILDRRLSASVGAPSALHDEDITVPTVSGNEISAAPVISVQIGQLLGNVLGLIYGVDGKLDKTFVSTVRTVLKGIANLSDELAAFSESCFGEVSRVAAHLNLAYHQCIVLTTRPFLFYLLKRRLESGRTSATSPLSSSAKGIVQVCIDSATQIISILSKLKEHDLMDAFLPFDLDSGFSSAFVLLMAASVHPKLLPENSWLATVFEVLDDMISKGSLLAKLRRSEIEELAQMLKTFNQGPSIELVSPAQSRSAPVDHASLPSLGDPFFDEWNLNDGLSGEQIMSLADTLDGSNIADLWLQNDYLEPSPA